MDSRCDVQCLVGPIVQQLEDHIGHQSQQKIARAQLASDGAQIVWADDLAIPVLATTNEDLGTEVQQIFVIVEEAFMSKGMRLNMSRGKTEAMLTYAGSGSKDARAAMRRDPRLPLEGENARSLSLGSQYKHLGTTLTSGGQLGQEVKRRVGLAWGAFRSMARQVFTNVALKETTRLFLVESLIFSKLYIMGVVVDPCYNAEI